MPSESARREQRGSGRTTRLATYLEVVQIYVAQSLVHRTCFLELDHEWTTGIE